MPNRPIRGPTINTAASATHAPTECTTVAECPDPAPCETPICLGGVCGTQAKAAGEPAPDFLQSGDEWSVDHVNLRDDRVEVFGALGPGETVSFACALRAVTSVDGMTADYYPFTHDFLGETATRIINEVPGINRVTYDITSKPPGTIEWE